MHATLPTAAPGLEHARSADLRPFLIFIRRPVFAGSAPGRLSGRNWLGWIGLLLLAAVLCRLLDRLLIDTFHWPVPARTVWLQFLEQPSWAAVVMLLSAPALEELGFRAFLSTAPRPVFTGLALFPAYLFIFIRNNLVRIPSSPSPGAVLTAYLHALWVIVPAAAISLLLCRYRREAVLAFFRERAGWVFWTSCIVFGAGHNVLYSNGFAWWGFALVLPQFVAGIGLGYIRASFGLRWSIASHYAFDAAAVVPSWLYLSASPSSLLHYMFLMSAAVVLAVLAYGVVGLRRVALLLW